MADVQEKNANWLMKYRSSRIVVFLAGVLIFSGSQLLLSPKVQRDAAIPSLRYNLKAEARQLPITDASSTAKVETTTIKDADNSDTSPPLHPVGSPSASPVDLPPDVPSNEPSASPSSSPTQKADELNSSVLSPKQMPSIQPGDPSTRREESSIPISDNYSQTSTSDIIPEDNLRTFSLPRANLKSTMSATSGVLLPPNMEKDAFKCDTRKWAVITTISDPTEAVIRMSKLPEWCLVVVADIKTPADYMEKLAALMGSSVEEKSNTFFFSVEVQKEWEELDGPIGTFAKAVPWGNVGRKNMGYLFAIIQGAEFVFDFDEYNYIKLDENTEEPLNILPSDSELEKVTIAAVGPTTFNHYPMMMDPSSILRNGSSSALWPRGFPLEHTTNNATEGKAAFQQESMPFVSDSSLVGVIQFLADGRPDFDPRIQTMSQQNIVFRNNPTHVLVPKHSYSPYNSQASIHTQPALWATLLPVTVSDRVSDIWRSYFAQCIFADSNLRLVFAPPKMERRMNQTDGKVTEAESDEYEKSGKLIEFLSHWDSDHLNVPERVEQLWIDLYERSYIEQEDVLLLQKWLEALVVLKYQFPEVHPRFRNVAIMAQFNFADFPSIMLQVLFWIQKMRERFQTAFVAGPFDKSQVAFMESHGLESLISKNDLLNNHRIRQGTGYYTPLSNLMEALMRYRNSSTIEAVLYVHDDALLNVTELSEGKYPFPTDKIIANRMGPESKNSEFVDLRTSNNRKEANRMSHRVFAKNGTLCSVDKTIFAKDGRAWKKKVPNFMDNWGHWNRDYCAKGQIRMAQDPEFAKYLDEDGTAWFPMRTQSDFLIVPTKYAEEFAQAGRLHLKHRIWIECAFAKVVDMLTQQRGAEVRLVRVCTDMDYKWRGKFQYMKVGVHDGNLKSLTINKLNTSSLGLIGREKEASILCSAFHRVVGPDASSDDPSSPGYNHKEVLFIQGFSGVGKSVLAKGLEKDVAKTHPKGVFVEGKFDLNSSDEPLSAVADPFGQIFSKITGPSSDLLVQVAHWLTEAMQQDDARMMTHLIPELGLAPEKGQQRWNYAFRVMARTLTESVSPIVIVLDDLQWADVSSLAVMELLLSDVENPNPVMIVGCYRSEEVDENRFLFNKIAGLKAKSHSFRFGMTEIQVESFGVYHVNQMIMAMLSIDDKDKTKDLAAICFKRTEGNPYFLIEFLQMLQQKKFFEFNL